MKFSGFDFRRVEPTFFSLQTYGANADQLKAEIGGVVSLEEVEKALLSKKYKILTLTHVDTSYRFPKVRDAAFFVGSIVAGCYLVYSGNEHGYFHVMKSAPPVGTLWIWSVVEMSLPFAAASALAVLGYVYWNGFKIF